MAKHIEAEYLSMVEQMIIASDDKMNILYNNYHEKFYNKIIKRCTKAVNMKYIRMKSGTSLFRCFSSNKQENLQTEKSTIEKIIKMSRVFEFDENNDEQLSHYRTLGILNILNCIHEYDQRIKRAYMLKSVKQIEIEDKRNQIVPLNLLVEIS